jgi:hypothetical protein
MGRPETALLLKSTIFPVISGGGGKAAKVSSIQITGFNSSTSARKSPWYRARRADRRLRSAAGCEQSGGDADAKSRAVGLHCQPKTAHVAIRGAAAKKIVGAAYATVVYIARCYVLMTRQQLTSNTRRESNLYPKSAKPILVILAHYASAFSQTTIEFCKPGPVLVRRWLRRPAADAKG